MLPHDQSVYLRPLLAWRAWKVNAGGRLASLFHPAEWPPGTPLRAQCFGESTVLGDNLGRCTAAPNVEGECGIYGSRCSPILHNEVTCIVGLAWLWGEIIEHEEGWRATWAYPAALVYTWCRHRPCQWCPRLWDDPDWSSRILPAAEALLWRASASYAMAQAFCLAHAKQIGELGQGSFISPASIGASYRVPVLDRQQAIQVIDTNEWQGRKIGVL